MHGTLYTHQASQVTIAHDQTFCRRLIDGDQLQLARAAATLLQASEEAEKTQDASEVALKVLGCQTAATLWLQMGIRRYTMRSAEAISARPDTAVTKVMSDSTSHARSCSTTCISAQYFSTRGYNMQKQLTLYCRTVGLQTAQTSCLVQGEAQ